MLVVDAEEHTASFAAAGIINPVTGHRYVKSWMIDILLPHAIKTYDEISQILGFEVYQKLNILRTMDTVKEQNDWDARKNDERYNQYVVKDSDVEAMIDITNDQHAYGEVTKSLQVKLKSIILGYRDLLLKNNQYSKMKIDYNSIIVHNDCIEVNNVKAKKIIFCEGHSATENPFFKCIPFLPAKGNALIIKGDFLLKKNVKDKLFITPLEDGSHWVGSGYEWNTTDESPNEIELQKMQAVLSLFLAKPFTVIEKLAGIRPSIKGRRPALGRHKTYQDMYIFNGLGTKGSSLAPYFANMLVDFIFDRTALIDDVNIDQF